MIPFSSEILFVKILTYGIGVARGFLETLFIQAAVPSYSHGHAAFPALREVHRNAQHKET